MMHTDTRADGALISRLQDHLIEQKRARLPGWNATADERRAFTAMVAEALVDLNAQPRPPETMPELAERAAVLMTGIGVLTPLLYEAGIEEIIVRDGHVQVERNGIVEDLGKLAAPEHFEQVANRVADLGGATFKGNRALVVVDLPPFGDRFTAIKPPLSANGVAINIRRFARSAMHLSDLVAQRALPEAAGHFLADVVRTNAASMLIVGASGAGKTTLLNALTMEVPHTTQLAIAETFRELRPGHPHPVRAVAPSELTGRGGESGLVTLREVVNTVYTRMRPDLIVVGEVVGAEAVEFLRAVNLGSRAATTIHGNSCLDGLLSLETLAVQYGALAQPIVRQWIARGVDLVVHVARKAGRRFVAHIAVLEGLDPDSGDFRLQTLYRAEEMSPDRSGSLGRLYKQIAGGVCHA